ncbi:MAG TPA: O-antigen ligase family protein [Anaerolineales bacterium]
MNRQPSTINVDSIILYLAFVLASLRASMFVYLHPDTSILLGPAWIEIALWIFIVFVVGQTLLRDGQMNRYLVLWRRTWLPAAFVLLALASVRWSIGPAETLFRALELLFATLTAAYFGMRLIPEELMDTLFWFGAVVLILSLALVFGAPPTGTMYWEPFNGAWRGVYWHRNHLASIAAFVNIIYLCRMVLAYQRRNPNGVLDGILYVFSFIVLYFTRSATGYILWIVMHAFVGLVLVWLRIYHRLQKRHYAWTFGAGLLAAVLALSNLDVIFGLFNRDTTMTGRVVLWNHLLDLASRRLWVGHGFGAVWNFDWFREEIKQLAGWPSQPLIADNGLLDIFLHLGMTGVVLFVGVLVFTTVRSVRYALAKKTLAGFFPLLIMVYALFANISFSLFAETEVFVWFLMIAALFMTSLPSEHDTATL